MKKQLLLLTITTFLYFVSNGQGESIKTKFSELKIGEKMPDISLGATMNNTAGKKRFSDFKGKLIILDFWSTGCSYCLESFPHMSALQKEFGDQIQIFLVNPWQTEENIKKHLTSVTRFKDKQDIFPANLTILTDAKDLGALFPVRSGLPYHVWIDGEGIVRLRGHYFNTNEEKIKDLLAGKKINFIRDGNSDFNPYADRPLYTVFPKIKEPVLKFSSLLTSYNDQLGGNSWGGAMMKNYLDSISGTVRSTFINCRVVDLYLNVAQEMIKEDDRILKGFNKVRLLVKDTLRYTDEFSELILCTDKMFSNCRFSYEQITPVELSDSLRKYYMLQDLNRYFGTLYGAEGQVKKQKMSCWTLVRTSALDRLKHIAGDKVNQITEQEAKEKGMYWIKGKDFKESLSDFFTMVPNYTKNIFSSYSDPVIDKTGYVGKIDIVFPAWKDLKSLEDIRNALRQYDLDLVWSGEELDMLVIEEEGAKK